MTPQMKGVLSAISNLCKVFGVVLAANGLASSGLYFWAQVIGGSIMVIGPAIWDVYEAISNAIASKRAQAVGVAAGINLTVSGAALAADGKTVVSANDGSTPPKPVTMETAEQIVKDFGPAPSTIAKS